MREEYFEWLVDLLQDDYLRDNYQKLLWKLFTTEFTWIVDYDSNRAKDGIYLRYLFSRDIDEDFDMDIGCTVLEMMVALSRRCEDDIMYDPDIGDRTGYWFWTMIQNLTLDIYDDYMYDERAVEYILEVVLERKYTRNGHGGLFPCDKNGTDFRKMDLWWQLNTYLNEEFPV